MSVGAGPGAPAHSLHLLLTCIPGKVEVEDVGAVDTEVLQPPKVGLQLPIGQLCLQQQDQMAKNKGVQGGRAGEREKGQMEVDSCTERSTWSRRKKSASEGEALDSKGSSGEEQDT